ncbi:extracellular solute-binding protein [Arthrobacter sp. 24S4-2]|uniref:ABC transporter substrate-binding protein n=1 Tax=Arthrobacter sp. 24S4-2 TaxID=2575374 RepID=UPI0010C7D4FA|nr:extracellular solute-binding protein [Arthrobacter sp. 24S4-2]QCP00058.1 extracellular solute-binding protein [Arthrobacter sp. 24S4-2]
MKHSTGKVRRGVDPADSTRNSRGRLVAITMLAVGSLLLAGCTSTGAGGAGGAGDKTVLKVYGWKGGDAEPANVKEINAAFEKANPDITLEYSFIPSAAYPQRVQSELLAGNAADVIMTDSAKVQDWGSSGYLEDLSSQPWVTGVRKELKPFVENDGKTYSMPMEVIGISLFANNALLQKAGITQNPATWPEFEADLQKAKDAGITPLSLPNKGGWTGDAAINAIAASLVYKNQPSFDSDFVQGKASFSSWKSSLQQMMDLQSKGFIDFKSELGVDEWSTGISDFQAGKSAFYLQGAWNQSTFTKAGLDNSFIPWPATDKPDSNANLFVGTMLSVNAKSKVKTAAEKYVEFWSAGKNASLYLEAENAVSPFTNGENPSGAATKTFVAAVNDGRYRILPSNTWLSAAGEKTLQEQVQALWLGQQSIDQTVKNLDEKLKPTK